MSKNAAKCAYSRYRGCPYRRERAAENLHDFISSWLNSLTGVGPRPLGGFLFSESQYGWQDALPDQSPLDPFLLLKQEKTVGQTFSMNNYWHFKIQLSVIKISYEQYSIVGDETTIGSWDAAAEVITCAFVDLYQQADSCIAGGF